jgi:Tfp pilus assembly protein PilF
MKKLRLLLIFPLLVISLLLSGCIPDTLVRASTASDITPARNMRVGRVIAEEGIARLKQGKVDEALRIFNAGLKFEPDNPGLHFLNGLAYHISGLRGDTNARALAEAGYQMTLALDPGHFHAAMQLARLYLDSRDYQKAAEAFRHALKIDPEAGDAYLGLASAAYYDRDLTTAASAMNKAYPKLPSRTDAARAAAIIYAAAGDQIHSGDALSNFETLERDNSIREAVNRRVGQWRTWRVANSASAGATPVATPSLGIPLAPEFAKPSQPGDAAPASAAAAAPGMTPAANEPMQRRWTDCDTAPPNPQNFAASSSANLAGNTGDETTYLPPLPAPCKSGGLPRMAVIDVVIIRTEDTSGSSHGVNLLSGLNLFFSYARTTQLIGGGAPPNTRAMSWGLGANPTTAVSYSLNIANASDTRSEVLARPTLVALDRQPSNFFSGRNLTLGISGQAGGTSTLADRPIGISLSLTPTFVNDESLLVSVRASRSFLEEVSQSVGFDNSIQTSRNAVTANVLLTFGQTLILSGLTEHEIQRVSSGVPVLKDIPALQYLFSKNFTSSVIILLTPRKPVRDAEDAARAIAERASGRGTYAISAMAEDYLGINKKATSTLDSALWHTRTNSMYFQFRNGDLQTDEWNEGGRLDSLLRDIGHLIYF